jgi:hypothetical protein
MREAFMNGLEKGGLTGSNVAVKSNQNGLLLGRHDIGVQTLVTLDTFSIFKESMILISFLKN